MVKITDFGTSKLVQSPLEPYLHSMGIGTPVCISFYQPYLFLYLTFYFLFSFIHSAIYGTGVTGSEEEDPLFCKGGRVQFGDGTLGCIQERRTI